MERLKAKGTSQICRFTCTIICFTFGKFFSISSCTDSAISWACLKVYDASAESPRLHKFYFQNTCFEEINPLHPCASLHIHKFLFLSLHHRNVNHFINSIFKNIVSCFYNKHKITDSQQNP